MGKNSRHKTKSICIKKAKIDINMIPIVNWLNSFSSITTQYCCEGNKDFKPYVLFICTDPVELIQILALLCGYATVEINFYNGILRYRLSFCTKENIRFFKEYLTITKKGKEK